MDFEHVSFGYWIILIIIALLAGIIGYQMGKAKSNPDDDNNGLKIENEALKAQLENYKEKVFANTLAKKQVASSEIKQGFNANAAKAAFGKRIKENDLKLVEGIGPKIEGLFHNFGIKTWKALSEVSTNKCQEVLNSGGDRYRIHDPASWPMQAKMAYEGQWEELAKWQDKHIAGKF